MKNCNTNANLSFPLIKNLYQNNFLEKFSGHGGKRVFYKPKPTRNEQEMNEKLQTIIINFRSIPDELRSWWKKSFLQTKAYEK